jgi:hypothetical protein
MCDNFKYLRESTNTGNRRVIANRRFTALSKIKAMTFTSEQPGNVCVDKVRLKINFTKGGKNLRATLYIKARNSIQTNRFCWLQSLDAFANIIIIINKAWN